MPSARRWSVSDGRKLVSALLVLVATFMVCASVGAQSWIVAALGVAVLAAAVAFYVVSALNSREFAYIPGSAHVVSCSPPPAAASQGRCEMHLVVHAPGMDDVAVKIRDAGVPVSKWPDAGATLPILVAVGDPRRVRVLWDSVRSHGDVAEGLEDEEYQGEPIEEAYLDDLLDDEYEEDPAPLGDLDPDARVIELDVMDPTLFRNEPAEDYGPALGRGAQLDPDTALSADADLSPDAGLAGSRRDSARDSVYDRDADADAFSSTGSGRDSYRNDDDVDRAPHGNGDGDSYRNGDVRRERFLDDGLDPGDGSLYTDGLDPEPEPPVAPPRRRPSPRRPSPRTRRTLDDQPPLVDASAESGGVTTIPHQPNPAERDNEAAPLQVTHVVPADPAVVAIPAPDADQDVSEAYLTVTPPPGGPTTSSERVQGVSVTLFVANLGRSVAFYRDLLGFRQVDMGLGSAVLESGDGRIVLRRVVDMAPVDRRLVHLLLEVPDVQAAYDELLLQDVEFVHRPRAVSRYEQLELLSAAFRDPDGHGIALVNWKVRR